MATSIYRESSAEASGLVAQGVIFIHSAPAVLLRHVEWAIRRALTYSVSIQWTSQPVEASTFRAEIFWSGPVGTGAIVSSELRGWNQLRFEVTEEPSFSNEGSRWSFTPTLGLFHSQTDSLGNLQISEFLINQAIAHSGANASLLMQNLQSILGSAWDLELEDYRSAGMSAPSVWINQVG